ncbi:MAG: LytTR family DNA-binding domain-containing protein [Bacteroidota bacterium]
MIRALIIDDEEDAREALRLTVTQYCSEVDLVAVCSSPEEGIQAIKELQPELVFLDIQMPRMSGFELLQQLSPVNFEVIFATAHDHYAIKAIRFSALDYLLKPVDVDDLIQATSKVQERIHQKNSTYQYQSVLNNMQYRARKLERLAIPTLEGIEFFRTDDIIYCRADGNYTKLFLQNQPSQLISRNLKDFESLLGESGFCRVHHSSLINLAHIQKYVKGEGGYVTLTDNHHVDISRRKKEEFLKLLNRL